MIRNFEEDIELLKNYEKFIIDKLNLWAEKNIITVSESYMYNNISVIHYANQKPFEKNFYKVITDFIKYYELDEHYNKKMIQEIEDYYHYSITIFLKHTVNSIIDKKLNDDVSTIDLMIKKMLKIQEYEENMREIYYDEENKNENI